MKNIIEDFNDASPRVKLEMYTSSDDEQKKLLFPEVQKIFDLEPKQKKRFLSLLFNQDNPVIKTADDSIYKLILEINPITGSWPESFLDLDQYPTFQIDSNEEKFYITENAEEFLNSLIQFTFFETKDVFSETPPNGIETDAGFKEIQEEKFEEFDFFAEIISQAQTLSDLHKFLDPEYGVLKLHDYGLMARTTDENGRNIVDLINDKALEIIRENASTLSKEEVGNFPFKQLAYDRLLDNPEVKAQALKIFESNNKDPKRELLARKQEILKERENENLSPQRRRRLRQELARINLVLRKSIKIQNR